jgi:hypothetical protein
MRRLLHRAWPLALVGMVMLFLGCGGGGGGSDSSSNIDSGPNVQAIAVNGGPTADSLNGSSYPNVAYTSVTICVPGTSRCQTITGVLVDTGSSGLRLLSSAVTLSLPAQTADGEQLAEYLQFADGTYVWGPVMLADVKIASETASSVPIQLLGHDEYAVPAGLVGSGTEADDVESLGANGILGVGPFQQDCGGTCASTTLTENIAYYGCDSQGCVQVTVPSATQVQNPVAHFATDNNGVIIKLPAVSGSIASVTGSMIFGIGTRPNNGLGNATVLMFNSNSSIATVYKGRILSYSFIDSGSNAFFFPDSTIPQCMSNYYSSFYCPGSPLPLSANNYGANGSKSRVTFTVDDTETLFSDNGSNSAFSTLAGPNMDFSGGEFDWGLPFFYGRSVYTSIEGKITPAGTSRPFWAY